MSRSLLKSNKIYSFIVNNNCHFIDRMSVVGICGRHFKILFNKLPISLRSIYKAILV